MYCFRVNVTARHAEIIIDNDGCLNTGSTYAEHTADKVWLQGTGKGFAHLRPQYIDFENPFKEGTFRIAETVKKEKKARPNGFPKYLKTDNMQSMYPIRLFPTAVTMPFIPFIIKAGYPNSKSTRNGGGTWFIWELSVLMPEKAMPAR